MFILLFFLSGETVAVGLKTAYPGKAPIAPHRDMYLESWAISYP
ncbi:hypothetical protein [Chitinophaga eiseniae]|nr:hypothetical protein [Chitinophaga eiseniae]